MKFHKWTSSQINFLKKNYGIKPLKTISKVLGRPLKSISNKAYNLKLYEVKNQKWTGEQIASLKELFPNRNYSIAEIAEKLGHSESGVCGMASELKLHRYKKLDAAAKKYIASHHKKLTYKQMAQVVGVSKYTLERYCLKEGFTNSAAPKWSPEDISYLKNNYKDMSIPEICKALGRSEFSIYTTASQLRLKKYPK